MSDFSLWFNSYMNKFNRVALHVLMWFLFGLIVELGLILSAKLSFYSSLFFLGRSLVANAIVFYLFFYVILPKYILKRKLWAAMSLTFGLTFLWQMATYLFIVLAKNYGEITDPLMIKNVNDHISAGFIHIFSIKEIFGGLLFIVASVSPLFCIKIFVDIIRQTHKQMAMEKEKSLLELNFLKSQLNPHFLFNTLNSIYILNMKKDKRASDVILELSDTLRYTLYESNTEQVLLEKEMDFLENYIKLESVRQNKQTRIAFDCDATAAGMLTIAPLLTFPFIENAFKHGLGTSIKDAWLEISAKIIGHTFHFHVKNSKNEENNGAQIRIAAGGIGLSNTKKRLALLYPGRYILDIVNTADSYSVELTINLKND